MTLQTWLTSYTDQHRDNWWYIMPHIGCASHSKKCNDKREIKGIGLYVKMYQNSRWLVVCNDVQVKNKRKCGNDQVTGRKKKTTLKWPEDFPNCMNRRIARADNQTTLTDLKNKNKNQKRITGCLKPNASFSTRYYIYLAHIFSLFFFKRWTMPSA